jgi:hypothetical protein
VKIREGQLEPHTLAHDDSAMINEANSLSWRGGMYESNELLESERTIRHWQQLALAALGSDHPSLHDAEPQVNQHSTASSHEN